MDGIHLVANICFRPCDFPLPPAGVLLGHIASTHNYAATLLSKWGSHGRENDISLQPYLPHGIQYAHGWMPAWLSFFDPPRTAWLAPLGTLSSGERERERESCAQNFTWCRSSSLALYYIGKKVCFSAKPALCAAAAAAASRAARGFERDFLEDGVSCVLSGGGGGEATLACQKSLCIKGKSHKNIPRRSIFRTYFLRATVPLFLELSSL